MSITPAPPMHSNLNNNNSGSITITEQVVKVSTSFQIFKTMCIHEILKVNYKFIKFLCFDYINSIHRMREQRPEKRYKHPHKDRQQQSLLYVNNWRKHYFRYIITYMYLLCVFILYL